MILFLLLGAIVATLATLFLFGGDGDVLGMSSDQFAQLGFLLAVGILVLVSFSGGQLRVSKIIRDVAIWAALGVALIGGYTYQDDLRPVWHKVVAEVSGERMSVEGEKVTVVSDGSDFRLEGRVNGTPLDFIFDTGASVVVLSHEDAQKIGIDTSKLRYLVPVQTANGETFAAAMILDQVSVGPIVRNRVRALISQKGALSVSLLGMSFINTLTQHSVRSNKLTLEN